MSLSLRISVVALTAAVALTTACTNKRVNNPLAKVDSKQPDKVLFDRGMDAMKHNHFDVARLDMQTLINTYPDSEFIARAKLALADSWYAEGGSTSWAQAEQEYKEFIIFFPNMPEAAEAQLKIANIHFQQMEKPDRDFTHAERAEQEYRQVILQYPDNEKMVADAKAKLLQVQEVIAEREFRVGRFYYLRPSYPAAIARLQSLVDRYPLYSKADESLYLIGQSWEGEIENVRRMDALERQQLEKQHKKVDEAVMKKREADRERYISDVLVPKAAEAYSKILTRYPAMERSDDAKARLLALHQPVPRPTKAMLAQNKAEEDARKQESMRSAVMGAFSRHPDVTAAAKVGAPTLQDQDLIDPAAMVRQASGIGNKGSAGSSGTESLSVQAVGTGVPDKNQEAPRSDTPPAENPQATDSSTQQPPAPDPNDLKPSQPSGAADPNAAAAEPDPNELKPNVAQDTPPPQAPAQVNELAADSSTQKPAADANTSSGDQPASDSEISSSKHHKKKGLKKIIPVK